MAMKEIVVESINIGLPNKEMFQEREITTGICKKPVQGPLTVTVLKKSLRLPPFQGPGSALLRSFERASGKMNCPAAEIRGISPPLTGGD